MHQALYRSFRPETFEGILGQEHIVKILGNQIRNGTTGHAYLFCGTRGTGKTSTARILAKGVNCEAPQENRPCGVCDSCIAIKDGIFLDVIEIDAASNNGVDNIRELRESVKYPPVTGRCKVYIIDEVHMLSTGAFNALLKTLEEPPSHVMFILATTEPHKLPATILSRCLRLDFRRVPEKLLKEGMLSICKKLGVEITDGALGIIAANGDGSVRDSLSLLDQCITGGHKEITRDDVLQILGTRGEEVFIEITDMVGRGEVADALVFLDRIISEGVEVRQFMKDWIAHYRNLMMTKFISDPENILNVSEENVERIREQSRRIPMAVVDRSIVELASVLLDAKWSTQPRILLELCIVRLAAPKNSGQPVNDDGDTTVKIPIPGDTTGKKTDKKPDGELIKKPMNKPDMDRIWKEIIKEGESKKGTFNILKIGCRLAGIEEDCFRLEPAGDMAFRYANDNAEFISQLMEKHMGRRLRMECCLVERKEAGRESKTSEQIASEVGNRLNIDVEVK